MRTAAYRGQGGLAPAAIDCSGWGLARLVRLVRTLWSDRAGATAIEYGIITVLIAVGAMTVAQSLGATENDSFATLSTGLDTDAHSFLPPLADDPPPDPWAPDGMGPDSAPQMAQPPRPPGPPGPPPDPAGAPADSPAGAIDPGTADGAPVQAGADQLMLKASPGGAPSQ